MLVIATIIIIIPSSSLSLVEKEKTFNIWGHATIFETLSQTKSHPQLPHHYIMSSSLFVIKLLEEETGLPYSLMNS